MGGFQYQEEPKAKQNVDSSANEKQSKVTTFSHVQKCENKNTNGNQQCIIEMATSGRVIINNSNSLITNLKAKDAVNNLKTKFNIALIPLSILTGILTFIVAFPKSILDNHILKVDTVESPPFLWWWLLSLTLTIIVWVISLFYRKKIEQKLSNLNLESEQKKLFDSFTKDLRNPSFSKDDFTTHISERLKGSGKFKKRINEFFISIVTIMDISQDISNLIINKAINKEIIVVVNKKSLLDLYEITTELPRQPLALLPSFPSQDEK